MTFFLVNLDLHDIAKQFLFSTYYITKQLVTVYISKKETELGSEPAQSPSLLTRESIKSWLITYFWSSCKTRRVSGNTREAGIWRLGRHCQRCCLVQRTVTLNKLACPETVTFGPGSSSFLCHESGSHTCRAQSVCAAPARHQLEIVEPSAVDVERFESCLIITLIFFILCPDS